MGKIQLLDCTLRDGGYVNDWEFGYNNLISIFERLTAANIDIIEVGFLDEHRPYDRNRSIMPDTASVEKIWSTVEKRPSMVVGMIDFGTCPIENLQPCSESYLDGIRVIFKKHKMHAAMEYCRQVKKLGYKVFSQLVSITSYNDEELLQLVELVNEVEPYAVSIVDTYGLLQPHTLLHYYDILDENVKESIQIGFHSHNNLQLAFANDIAFLTKDTKHDIVIDATLFGMGKSAGNAPIELVAEYLNEHFDTQYNLHPIFEAIEESVVDFYKKSPWGYKMFFYLSSRNRCHPNYVSYFMRKKDLSVSKLDELLNRIEPEEKKLLYDEKVAEEIFSKYILNETNDEAVIKQLQDNLANKKILVLGPGKTIHLQKEKVMDYIKVENPIIISINYIPEAFSVDYVYVTNRSRYQQMTESLKLAKNNTVKIIATSNVESRNEKFDYVMNREPLLEKSEVIEDNSFLMLLKVLEKANVKKLVCAGLDGYSTREDNYFNPEMEYAFVKDAASYLNHHIKNAIYEEHRNMNIEFITYSHYTDKEGWNDAAF